MRSRVRLLPPIPIRGPLRARLVQVSGVYSLCAMSGSLRRLGWADQMVGCRNGRGSAAVLSRKIQCVDLLDSARQGELTHRRPSQLIRQRWHPALR